MAKFKPVSSQVNFPALEREILQYWEKEGIVEKYLKRNEKSNKKFSFLDGPITANNPMGVHHAWGRTYKDLWQRFFNMKGYKQRFQNGFDNQGLWVEVEVEKKLGFKSKKDIEKYGIDKFIQKCKEHTLKFAAIQTEQSKRLGYFMDWQNSYYTMSDENNYMIWHFLKKCHDRGLIYKGWDCVPWCPRCGTAISQHEIATEEYQEVVHDCLYIKYPLKGREETYLLVWTTTPWTLPANVAVAVDPNLKYAEVGSEDGVLIVAKGALKRVFGEKVKATREYKGADLIDREYLGLFDRLAKVNETLGSFKHRVVSSDPVILPISPEEGTGLVHIAPGAGAEDFALGKKENLPVIAPLDETAIFVSGFGELSGLGVKEVTQPIISHLEKSCYLYKIEQYKHRYPTCWRCKTELVWRVVDEWYIRMDDLRKPMMEVAKKINWIPSWGLERELDWLKNMHDWLISKKRYWGLCLPIWECDKCKNFEVVGSKEELKERAVVGWEEFAGHSPHRPYLDKVKIKCSKCGAICSRIPDVGNPWLDAGIVPFSTMPADWFPADFITEALPGQYRNWFYSLIVMSTVLKNTNPFKTILGYALVRDEKGEEMHKSKGNAIWFDDAAEKIGVDVMRWLFLRQNPQINLNFGYHVADQIRRRFHLILWNCYKFFVDYANLSNWETNNIRGMGQIGVLDRWILAKLNQLVTTINYSLQEYDAASACGAIEDFVICDFSTWYIRRSRGRVVFPVMYEVLLTLAKLMAPFMPFIAEEYFRNLTGKKSVHLENYPLPAPLTDEKLIKDMARLRKIVESAHAKRKELGIRLRQPLANLTYKLDKKLDTELEEILADEVNVKKIEYRKSSKTEPDVELDTKITQSLKEEGEARDLIRQIQQLRKEMGLTLKDKTKIIAPRWPKKYETTILQSTSSVSMEKGPELKLKSLFSKDCP